MFSHSSFFSPVPLLNRWLWILILSGLPFAARSIPKPPSTTGFVLNAIFLKDSRRLMTPSWSLPHPKSGPESAPVSLKPIPESPVKRPDFPFSKKCQKTALIAKISH
jgi:hypothetical protein